MSYFYTFFQQAVGGPNASNTADLRPLNNNASRRARLEQRSTGDNVAFGRFTDLFSYAQRDAAAEISNGNIDLTAGRNAVIAHSDGDVVADAGNELIGDFLRSNFAVGGRFATVFATDSNGAVVADQDAVIDSRNSTIVAAVGNDLGANVQNSTLVAEAGNDIVATQIKDSDAELVAGGDILIGSVEGSNLTAVAGDDLDIVDVKDSVLNVGAVDDVTIDNANHSAVTVTAGDDVSLTGQAVVADIVAGGNVTVDLKDSSLVVDAVGADTAGDDNGTVVATLDNVAADIIADTVEVAAVDSDIVIGSDSHGAKDVVAAIADSNIDVTLDDNGSAIVSAEDSNVVIENGQSATVLSDGSSAEMSADNNQFVGTGTVTQNGDNNVALTTADNPHGSANVVAQVGGNNTAVMNGDTVALQMTTGGSNTAQVNGGTNPTNVSLTQVAMSNGGVAWNQANISNTGSAQTTINQTVNGGSNVLTFGDSFFTEFDLFALGDLFSAFGAAWAGV
ncbi:MAG: hypothetical protein KC476_07295 [Cyanobacteria bacterium HKST-UBA06]|nr:hypothetical protein [Cyanobacteria bacterium HKST-UBA06]